MQSRTRIAGAITLVLGLGAIGVWILLLANGALDDDSLVFRLAADAALGAVAITAGVGLLAKRDWARTMSLLALGAIVFAALSGLAWAVDVSVWLSLAAIAAGLAALWAIRHLVAETGRVYRALRMLPSPMERILDHDELGPHFAEELARMSGKS